MSLTRDKRDNYQKILSPSIHQSINDPTPFLLFTFHFYLLVATLIIYIVKFQSSNLDYRD
jgi:hypothetical protein